MKHMRKGKDKVASNLRITYKGVLVEWRWSSKHSQLCN